MDVNDGSPTTSDQLIPFDEYLIAFPVVLLPIETHPIPGPATTSYAATVKSLEHGDHDAPSDE
jgi:hypothetical protein